MASAGDVEGASIVAGNLETRGDLGREYRLGFRDRTLAVIADQVAFREWKKHGAAMDRHEIVAYALAALQRVDSAEPVTKYPESATIQ